MAEPEYDLFVIGAGSGGVRAARMAAAAGARVAVAEEARLGGTCVNLGCIPKKLMVYASHFADDFRDARGYGWTAGPARFDWATFRERKDREIERLNRVYEELLRGAGVEILRGRARLRGPGEVEVAGRRCRARNILIATGGAPHRPEIPGIEHAITSDDVFHLKELPRRIAIVGGGYIAVEFAGILRGLGSEVVQLYRGPLFLRGFDADLRGALADEMRARGIDLRFEARVAAIDRAGDRRIAILEDGSRVEADQVLYATGRRPATAGLGLEEAGVALREDGAIEVDRYSRTSAPGIYAIGDVTDRLNLTPVAIHEAMCLVRTLFEGRPTAPDHENVPRAVFSQPPLATVGLSEDEARGRLGEVSIYRSAFRPLRHTLSENPERSVVKLVVDPATDRVVGAHMLGPDAPEIIQGVAIAVKAGLRKADFDATVGIHPTSAEEFVTLRTPVDD